MPDFGPRDENWSYEQSVFWERIDAAGQASLKVALTGLLGAGAALSQRVPIAMPRFTRHDATHLNNVLYWMQGLITPAGLDALGSKGCGLCLLLAYTHDLGMVPEPDWEKKLEDADSSEAVKLRRFTSERHPDLADLLERALPEEAVARASAVERCGHIRDFIRTDYLRVTHAEDGPDSRVSKHLKSMLLYNELRGALSWLCTEDTALKLVGLLIASHNQSIAWLEERLRGKDFKLERPWTWMANGAEPVNLLLPCLLLRLADICDFDASRTPRIVFHQLGLEGAQSLGLAKLDSAVGISHGEQQKHLAVDGWRWTGGDAGKLVYHAGDCPHPAVQKAIYCFRDDITTEFTAVERVLRSTGFGARDWLRIPREVEADVTPRGYAFHDVKFELQAHEVTKLLMGTALYGNPELCIRELLQNALDAVQLRELRHVLKGKLEDKRIDAPPEVEACERWITTELDQPKIELTWGRDTATGRDWIQVKDRGTGMTIDQITRYLSALGKSYYKSAEFGAEARLMREHGLIATPISQFGIGILSCFMVAEWMDVRTCPCGCDEDDRKAWQVKITGPGSLFHFTEWTGADTPGTEVRLYLKRDFALVDIPRDELIKQLRRELNYTRGEGEESSAYEREEGGVRYLNPAAVAARHVIWPRHAIATRCEGAAEALLTLDGRWHFERLCPWPQAEVANRAKEDGCPESYLTGAGWRTWDWEDREGAEPTGSRIRLVFPSCAPVESGDLAAWLGRVPDRVRTAELAHWMEKAMTRDDDSRQRYLVRGMRVPENKAEQHTMKQIAAGVGAWLWVDFAGAAGPALTADRARVRGFARQEDQKEWRQLTTRVFARWAGDIARRLPAGSEARAAFRQVTTMAAELRGGLGSDEAAVEWSLDEGCGVSWRAATSQSAAMAADWLVAERDRDRDRGFDRDRGRGFDRGFDLARTLGLALALAFDRNRAHILDLAPVHNRDLDLALGHGHALDRDLDRAYARLGTLMHANESTHFLNEGFGPSLAEAFPLLRLPARASGLAAARLLAPTRLRWTGGDGGAWVEEGHGYDLVFPFSAIPTPRWHRLVPDWVEDRDWRRLLTMPFLCPSTKVAETIAQAMRNPTDEPEKDDDVAARARLAAVQETARQIARNTLHVLLPRPDWWDRPFAEWTEADQAVCGYSAWWNLATGTMLWAVGAVPRDAMPERGLPIEAFLKSPQLTEFRTRCPGLFTKETATEG